LKARANPTRGFPEETAHSIPSDRLANSLADDEPDSNFVDRPARRLNDQKRRRPRASFRPDPTELRLGA